LLQPTDQVANPSGAAEAVPAGIIQKTAVDLLIEVMKNNRGAARG